ncbi:MAG: T9SS type A sorting domain-containing protein [Chitinophagaceae bacterium]
MIRILFLILISTILQFRAYSQETPIGVWQTHASSIPAFCIEQIGQVLYMGGLQIYTYDILEKEFGTLSKVNGLSDVSVKHIRHSNALNTTIIIYENGNIDLMTSSGIHNMPDLKNLNLIGSKKINDVTFYGSYIYLATDFGIVVINPEKYEIKESYPMQDNATQLAVRGVAFWQNKIYAVTSAGLYHAAANDPVLQNFAHWSLDDNTPMHFILNHQDKLFCASESTLYAFSNSNLIPLHTANTPIVKIRSGLQRFYVAETDDAKRFIYIFDSNGLLVDSTTTSLNPRDMVSLNDEEIWVADFWNGLLHLTGNFKDAQILKPNSIFSNNTFNLRIVNNDLYVAAGSVTGWYFNWNGDGFSKYSNGDWTTYNRHVNTPGLNEVTDILDVIVDKKTNSIYAASFGSGLYELKTDNTFIIKKNDDDLQTQIGNPNICLVTGFAYDNNQNLWMSNYSGPEQLVVKKSDGSWQKFGLPFSSSEKPVSEIVIDNANQKWVVSPRNNGLFVLNDNNTIDNKNDDQIRHLSTGTNYGNLPSNNVLCLTKDLDGKLWVGTNDGIGIFNCPESIMTSYGCDAELKIVKYDLNAGLLFKTESVNTIAVDGANNKWIGTDNGVWQITDDAEKILNRFTKDNSPLPSNLIRKIVVHPSTGEVFIATELGLVSFRSNATEGASNNDNILIYPNPVPSDYAGTVAIKGLVGNADVRITDISGQLVYKTKAQGGQASWNGKNYTGHKPRTGVYYVFVTNQDGSETKVGKFIYNE